MVNIMFTVVKLESLEEERIMTTTTMAGTTFQEKLASLEAAVAVEGMMAAACIGGMAGNGIVGMAIPQEEKLASLEEEETVLT
jgi:hypothetical protein